MKQEYKPFLIGGVSFMLSIYLLAFLFLALLTSINDFAGYPLYNFLGSNADLEAVVLKLLPAQNPYHLQKWNSLPLLTLVLSTVLFILALIFTLRYARQILIEGITRLLIFFILVTGLAWLTFSDVYISIGKFLVAFAQA